MAENKTKQTDESVKVFIDGIADEERKADCKKVTLLMQKITYEKPRMWGTAIVGFGSYHYKYESGREGDMCLIGLSPRKQNLTLYLMLGTGNYDAMLKKLGKHKTGKGCLYINKLSDINLEVLAELITKAMLDLRKKYPDSKKSQTK